jgi:hypothetical protein
MLEFAVMVFEKQEQSHGKVGVITDKYSVTVSITINTYICIKYNLKRRYNHNKSRCNCSGKSDYSPTQIINHIDLT